VISTSILGHPDGHEYNVKPHRYAVALALGVCDTRSAHTRTPTRATATSGPPPTQASSLLVIDPFDVNA
jgi:hypothetical protein